MNTHIMNEYFILLANKIVESSCGKTIIYVPNGGNWGDGIIREATLKFFNDFSIEYHELPFVNRFWKEYIRMPLIKEYLSDKVLIFGGGGAWYPIFSSGYNFVNYYHKFFKHTIILPSTLMLRLDSPDITFFCRDLYESKQYCPQAYFCHDMAFYFSNKISPEYLCTGQTGYFFRTDEESIGKQDFQGSNMDISLMGNEITPIAPFIKKINEFNIIHTDRLHVAILACLLHKKLHFYKGGYFKNEAVYKSSMEDYFDNVFLETRPT